MKEELTQAELDHIFYGNKPKVDVTFYTQPALNPTKSKEQGTRVMEDKEYIKLVCVKEDTAMARPATKIDIKMYPREYAAYVEDRDHERHRQVPDIHPEGKQTIGSAYAGVRAETG